MTNNTFHEQQFFNALRDIFVGAEIEGDSGFINLMQIKSRYYQNGVFPKLKKDIDQAVEDFPEFREELFDKLYTFFQRYFSESGSIYFRYTPLHQNIYEKVYTDDRDVVLFWKTHMLYYVKTDRIFKSLKVEVDGVHFYFDASSIEHKRANEKRDIVFSFREVAKDGSLVFDTAYSVRGRITKIEDILRDLWKEDLEVSDETLEKAFRVFEKQSEVDYFINKNARAFLEEQFDLWLYQYMFAEKNIWSAERIAQLQALKEIAYKVIGFISQFEDELVKIWNKPKFVRNSHYILTLDHFIEKDREDLLEDVFAHAGMTAQMKEWLELGMIDSEMEPEELLRQLTQKDLTGEHLHPKWLTLPLDTKHFPDMEIKLLSLFDELDDELDGWVVHSDNYQALKTLREKYKNAIMSIYIDPPYNTGHDDFIYKDAYQHSSWLSMMENRLILARDFLQNDALFGISIDFTEQPYLRNLLESIIPHTFVTEIANVNNPQGRSDDKHIATAHEYLIILANPDCETEGWDAGEHITRRYRHEDKHGKFRETDLRKTGKNDRREDRPRLFYYFYFNPETEDFFASRENKLMDGYIQIYPTRPDGSDGNWRWELKSSMKKIKSLIPKPMQRRDTWTVYEKDYLEDEPKVKPSSVWNKPVLNSHYASDMFKDLGFLREDFPHPKPVDLVKNLIKLLIKDDYLTLDYFAGSGTTAHAVMNLNREDGGSRKYILVEMGDHFEDVILPRIKKVAFHSKWKDGKPVFENGESGISHFVKYYDLEGYEECLQKVHYQDADLFDDPNQDPYHAYVFLRDLKLLESIEIDADSNRVRFHPERLYPDIDLAETLSHLRGKWIKRITEDFVEFQDGEKMSLTDPDWETLKPMVWWA